MLGPLSGAVKRKHTLYSVQWPQTTDRPNLFAPIPTETKAPQVRRDNSKSFFMLIFLIHICGHNFFMKKPANERSKEANGLRQGNELFSNCKPLCSSNSAQRSIIVRAAKARV